MHIDVFIDQQGLKRAVAVFEVRREIDANPSATVC